jgi:hypothetical protein
METVRYYSAAVLLLPLIGALISGMLLLCLGIDKVEAHSGDHPVKSGFYPKCEQAAVGRFDPIVYPGQTGVGHRHLFAGGDIRQNSTYSQLREGDTTCHFGRDYYDQRNTSSYWIPDLKTRRNEFAGLHQMRAFYRAGDVSPHLVQPHPSGLKVIARDVRGASVKWFCSNRDGADPAKTAFSESPYDCTNNKAPLVTAKINFPQCWDGKNNDSGDHMSHMAYPSEGSCPPTHPVELSRVMYTVKYDTSLGANAKLAGGDDPATDFHADLFSAWEPTRLEQLVNGCIRDGRICSNSPDKHLG